MAISIEVPDFVVVGIEVRIRIPDLLSTNVAATLLTPDLAEVDLSSNFRNLLGPIINGQELVYTFGRPGEYLLMVKDNVSGNYWYKAIGVHSWPNNIDGKISTVAKSRVEIERLRTFIRSEVNTGE